MATVRRYSSQEQVPVQQANLINAGDFPADTLGADILKTGSDIANVFAELAIRRQEAEDSESINAISEARDLANFEMQQFMLDNPDPDTWKEGRAKILAKQASVYASRKLSARARKNEEIDQKAFRDEFEIRGEIIETTQKIENAITLSGKVLIAKMSADDGTDTNAAADIDKHLKIYREALELKYPKEIVDVMIEETLREGVKARAEASIENIKPDLIDAISINNKPEDGYKTLNAATAKLVEDDILTKAEAAEANKKLGDWIDNYVAGRIKAAKEADKLSTIQAYQEMSKPILKGELTYEDIDNSGLRETRRSGENVSDAERWRGYIKGSYKDPPTKNTPEGHTASFAAVYDAATLQLSPKEAYDVLLERRFVEMDITNEQFEWAVNKIENPYPKHVLENLNAIMKSNLEDFNRLFSSDAERNKKVNESLINWVDDLTKQGKTPSKKEMFAMSSAFRAGGGQPYDIGGTVERGGRQWEIVGFDEDGEPLVELIE